VAQNLFLTTFGMVNPDGSINTSKRDSISSNVASNVVSVLQAGAFFGALGSAPITCTRFSSFYDCAHATNSSLWKENGFVRVLSDFQCWSCQCILLLVPPIHVDRDSFSMQALQTALGNGNGLSYIYSGRVIAGVGIGGLSAVAPTFVSECSPKDVRGRITGLFQIVVTTGVMLSYWINRSSPFNWTLQKLTMCHSRC
jgi:MFS family permease